MGSRARNDVDPQTSVTEQASHWWIVLNSGTASEADQQAFSDWVVRSPERLQAFLQTALMTKVLKSNSLRWPDTPEELLAREASEAPDVVPLRSAYDTRLLPDATPPNSRAASDRVDSAQGQGARRRVPVWTAALAACLLVFLGAAGWLLRDGADEFHTSVGEQRSVVLSDGSIVLLNTASHVRVSMRKDRRLIELLEGEALFEVARDATRPFDVVADGTQVRAVGTQFNVDKRALRTVVTVIEGRVTVSADDMPKAAEASQTSVSAGEQVSVTRTLLKKADHADIIAATAWTQRRLVFDRRPLGEVAAEFNRYNRRAIHIDSATLREQRISGMFQANDSDSLLDFIGQIPGVKIERSADGIIHVVDEVR